MSNGWDSDTIDEDLRAVKLIVCPTHALERVGSAGVTVARVGGTAHAVLLVPLTRKFGQVPTQRFLFWRENGNELGPSSLWAESSIMPYWISAPQIGSHCPPSRGDMSANCHRKRLLQSWGMPQWHHLRAKIIVP